MLASLIIGVFSAVLFLLASIAIYRAKDVFVMLQIISMSNFYVIPLILIAALLEKFSVAACAKILVIVILNIIVTNLLSYIIAKRAIINRVMPDADFKKILK